MNRRIVVKVGSNVLARRDGSLDFTRMSALVDQISEIRASGIEVILVSSGAVASGRSELKGVRLKKMNSVDQRQLYSAVGQAKLINRYFELFRDHGLYVGQVLTMKENFSTRTHYLNQRNCMRVMLANGVIPIVNENDTVSISELMFTDNDELSGLIATMMNADALIILSNVDGIYDGLPGDPGVKVIRQVSPDADLEQYVRTDKSGFGRGGMITKCKTARKVAEEGVEVIIANGKKDNILTDLMLGTDREVVCTRFKPSDNPVSSMKRWIAHSAGFTKGKIRLNADAVKAVTGDRAVSILAVGVTQVSGTFMKDDLVSILNEEGREIGVGRISCSSDEAHKMAGTHGGKPLIHYDYLYLE